MIDNQTTLLNKLIDKCTNPMEVTSFYRLTNNPDDPGKLSEILGIGKEHFTNIAIETLDILEGEEAFKAGWLDFKWKLSAFIPFKMFLMSRFINYRTKKAGLLGEFYITHMLRKK